MRQENIDFFVLPGIDEPHRTSPQKEFLEAIHCNAQIFMILYGHDHGEEERKD